MSAGTGINAGSSGLGDGLPSPSHHQEGKAGTRLICWPLEHPVCTAHTTARQDPPCPQAYPFTCTHHGLPSQPPPETPGICANVSSAGTCPTPATATCGSLGPSAPPILHLWCSSTTPSAPLRLSRSFPANARRAPGALLSDGGSKCCLVGPRLSQQTLPPKPSPSAVSRPHHAFARLAPHA